jgi:hypothetical protein
MPKNYYLPAYFSTINPVFKEMRPVFAKVNIPKGDAVLNHLNTLSRHCHV